jgi:acyl carrier protein phosphodiesterase
MEAIMNGREPPSLEQRIVAALANQTIGTETLAELINDVEQAAAAADQACFDEHALALDLEASPDAASAHQRVIAAEMSRDRLKASLPKLRDKLAGALEADRYGRWLSEYREVKTERDALVEEFADTYPRLASEMVDLFNRLQECDPKCSEVDAQASNLNAEHRRLSKVELRSRGLEAFSRDHPEIDKAVVLPDFVESALTRWPVQTSTSFAAAYAEATSAPYHSGQHWAEPEEVGRRRQEAGREQRRLAEFYSEQTATQESA